MRFSTAQIKKLPPALLTFSFISGFLGGAAVGSALHFELAFQAIQPVFAEIEAASTETVVEHQSFATQASESTQYFFSDGSETVVEIPASQGISPDRLRIPAIGVEASVIDLGLNPDGTLQVPEDFSQTGWWTGGARPGDRGAAVIVGHVDSRTGPAVFYRLQELRPGDEIQVMNADNQVVRFQVEQLRQVAKDNFPTEMVYGMTPEPTLRLITCGGVFDSASRSYRDNVIVFASRLEG
jgi:LPXTG-site transpeptidase (sortase) family protein